MCYEYEKKFVPDIMCYEYNFNVIRKSTLKILSDTQHTITAKLPINVRSESLTRKFLTSKPKRNNILTRSFKSLNLELNCGVIARRLF